MPDLHLEEWEQAIDEYLLIKKEGFDPFYVFTYLEPEEYEHYKQCVRLIENIIVIGFNSIRRRKRFATTTSYFQYLVTCSALNSFRTINEMYRSRYDDDCLAILRGIYEQYLKVKRLRLEPEAVVSFEAAVLLQVFFTTGLVPMGPSIMPVWSTQRPDVRLRYSSQISQSPSRRTSTERSSNRSIMNFPDTFITTWQPGL